MTTEIESEKQERITKFYNELQKKKLAYLSMAHAVIYGEVIDVSDSTEKQFFGSGTDTPLIVLTIRVRDPVTYKMVEFKAPVKVSFKESSLLSYLEKSLGHYPYIGDKVPVKRINGFWKIVKGFEDPNGQNESPLSIGENNSP